MIKRTQNNEVSAQSAKKMFEILSYTIERFFLECDKYYRYHKFVQKGKAFSILYLGHFRKLA